ncbi:uncharacterized protein LOC135955411 [Calliphora vicina]|uniref:uncharacterized protein LOC135955411 n=1 Tax=Calliphora vicina TaxID=7373 RepID=UPI00325C141C
MSNAMDKLKLIAEVRKRPALWDYQSEEHKSCLSLPEVWKAVAVSMESDVETCQFNWSNVCKTYRKIAKREELRIKKDMLNGSYDPNNDYGSKWTYFKPMEFMKDNQKFPIILRNSCERLKLIAEVRKRPAIWNIQSKDHKPSILRKLWTDVAVATGLDADTCKRKWKIVRQSYLEEVKKLELRIAEDKLKGSYNPNNDYSSKWTFYDHMKFIDDIKKPSPIKRMTLRNSTVNDNNSDDNNSKTFNKIHNMNNTKVEPGLDLDPEVFIPDDNTDSQMFIIEFVSEPNSPQNQVSADDKPSSTGGNCTKRTYDQANFLEDLEKEEHNLIKSAKVEPELDLDPEVYIPDDDTDSQMYSIEFVSKPNSPQNQESADDKPSSTGGNCTKRSNDQANFLENLETEEHNLTNSSHMDITRSNSMINVGDSDFNFLVSLLPQMKKINDLQKFKFRSKMINVMFNIMSASSSQNANSNN